MTRRSVTTAVALSAFGVLVAGCVLPAAPPDVNAEPTATATASGSEPNPDPSSSGSLEGRFTFETMNEYVDAVVPMIEQWMQASWPQMRLPKVVYVPAGETGPEGCLDSNGDAASYSSRSYEYCPPDETVYVGQRVLWEFYSATGDAGPAVGMAHEFGHHVQEVVGVPAVHTPAQSIVHENQADCLSGAWVKYTDEQRWLEYPDDLQDIKLLFPMIGSAEGPDRDHGTAEEREEAFNDGFHGGVTACGIKAG